MQLMNCKSFVGTIKPKISDPDYFNSKRVESLGFVVLLV